MTASSRESLPERIDLHTHTNESDGTLDPAELVRQAERANLAAIAITDHDTFTGYEKALPVSRETGLELICGIELNTKLVFWDSGTRSVHLLAYFVRSAPSASFLRWLEEQREERRDRNRRLASALQKRGIDITLEEVEARGRSLAGRPHFARILIEKGYAANSQEAFEKYLGETAATFVEHRSASLQDTIQFVRAGNGIPVLAHPVRLSLAPGLERSLLIELKEAGLLGLEVYHSEHSPALQARYLQLARDLNLLPTGGSDFHGAAKPSVALGTGINGNLKVPREFLDGMRETELTDTPSVK